MARLSEAYGRTIILLAVLAGILLACVVIGVAGDVIIRALGYQPFAATGTLSEYAMLWVTMLAGPWLVRSRGHIVVESLVLALPAAMRFWLERIILVLCALLALGIAWFAASLGWDAFMRGDVDVRSIDMPRWVLFFSLALGFALMSVEFIRLAIIGGTLQAASRAEVKDGL